MNFREMLVSPSKYNLKCPYSMSPIGIVVHNTANDASANNEVSYMINNPHSTSFHYAVDNVEVVQGLPLNRNSWSAGDGSYGDGNRKYLSIEICYSRSGGDKFIQAEKNCVKFIVKLLRDYGWSINNVKKHQDFSGKYCPHRTLDMGWNRFLDMIKVELGQEVTTPTPQPTTPPPSIDTVFEKAKKFNASRCKELQTKLNKVGYNCGTPDNIYGSKTHSALGRFQKDFGLVQDYCAGEKTFNRLNQRILELNPPKPQGNDWVRRLQQELNAQGYRDSRGQKLTVDGHLGEKTISAFPNLNKGAKGNIVRLVQELLVAKGYNPNGIDGKYGNGTVEAVKKYQRDRKISSDGSFGKQSLRVAF